MQLRYDVLFESHGGVFTPGANRRLESAGEQALDMPPMWADNGCDPALGASMDGCVHETRLTAGGELGHMGSDDQRALSVSRGPVNTSDLLSSRGLRPALRLYSPEGGSVHSNFPRPLPARRMLRVVFDSDPAQQRINCCIRDFRRLGMSRPSAEEPHMGAASFGPNRDSRPSTEEPHRGAATFSHSPSGCPGHSSQLVRSHGASTASAQSSLREETQEVPTPRSQPVQSPGTGTAPAQSLLREREAQEVSPPQSQPVRSLGTCTASVQHVLGSVTAQPSLERYMRDSRRLGMPRPSAEELHMGAVLSGPSRDTRPSTEEPQRGAATFGPSPPGCPGPSSQPVRSHGTSTASAQYSLREQETQEVFTPQSQPVRSFGTCTAPVQPQAPALPRAPAEEIPAAHEPALPHTLAYCVAAPVPVDPPTVYGGGYAVPVQQAGLLTEAEIAAQGRQYTVFEFQRRPRVRPFGSTWSLQDIVTDAIRSSGAPVRHVRVLDPALAGYPLPQLVLTRREAPAASRAIPCDLRHFARDVVTAEIPPQVLLAALPDLVRAGAPAPTLFTFPTGAVAWQDEVGRIQHEPQTPSGGWQWLCLIAGQIPIPAGQGAQAAAVTAGTTLTTTGARVPTGMPNSSLPAQRLMQLAAAEAADPYHQEGAGLYPSCIALRPAFLRQPEVVHRPLADLCLFESLRATTGGLEFTVHVAGAEAALLPAHSDWSLAAFFHAATGVTAELPQAVQLLMSGVPGLPEPQFVLTAAGADEPAVPVDFRFVGGPIVTVSAVPGQDIEHLVQAAPGLEESDLLQELLLNRDLFLQDARGGVHTAVPDNAAELQWLRVVSRAGIIGSTAMMPADAPPLTSTSTTTTAMQTEATTVRFTLTGAGMTMTTAPVPLQQFDVVSELTSLILAITRAGRLPPNAHVVMTAAWPLPRGGRHYNIPILVYTPDDYEYIVLDPSIDGSQVHSLVVQAGTLPEHVLSRNQENLGFAAWVNGAPQSAVRRPLRTGDFVQLFPGDLRVQYPVGHPMQLLGSVNRLQCLSAPLRVPEFNTVAARASHAGANAEVHQALLTGFDRATRARVEMYGLPSRTRQKVVLLEPGRAPHTVWLDLMSCPSVDEAEPLLRELRIFSADARILDSRIETLVAQVFIIAPREVRGMTYSVPNPIYFGAYTLIHLPADTRPPWHLLPVHDQLTLVPPSEGWIDGAGILVARPLGRQSLARMAPSLAQIRPGTELLPPPVASTAALPAEPASSSGNPPAATAAPATGAVTGSGGTSSAASKPMSIVTVPSSGGTSLAQLPDLRQAQQRRCRQAEAQGLVSDRCPCILGQLQCSPDQAIRAAADEAVLGTPGRVRRQVAHLEANIEAVKVSVATPFGRRGISASSRGTADNLLSAECTSANLGCNSLHPQGPSASELHLDKQFVEVRPLAPVLAGATDRTDKCLEAPSVSEVLKVTGSPDVRERRSLSLDTCIPAAADAEVYASLHLGLPADAKTLALGGFSLAHLCRKKPRGRGLHTASKDFLETLDAAPETATPQALLLYVDGSYESGRGAWAVCCLGLFSEEWLWVGYFAESISDALPVRSAFDAEIYAQLVAYGIAAHTAVPTTIYYDSQSAAAVASGNAKTSAVDCLVRAAMGLYMCAGVQGHWPLLSHVYSHQGDPLNELVDFAAKRALKCQGPAAPLGDSHVTSYILEGAFDWIWLYTARGSSVAWPSIDEDGRSQPVAPAPAPQAPCIPATWAADTQQDVPTCVRLHLRAVTYNTLSCKTALQRQCLSEYMTAHRIQILGLQETRHDTVGKACVQDILRFAGPAPGGQLGCQIWINTAAGPWARPFFRKAFQNERLLEVHAKLGDQCLVIIAGHSPTAVAPEAERSGWWRMLRDRLLAVPAGYQPLLLLDANARFQWGERAEQPTNNNARAFQELLDEFALQRTDAYESDGRPRVTWRPPAGNLGTGACLDYVVVPRAWGQHCTLQGVLPISDEHAGIDHDPVTMELDVQIWRPPRAARKLDRGAMLTPDGRLKLQQIYSTMPDVPWETSVDAHLQCINQHLQHHLAAAFPATDRPRKPSMSQSTWQLIADRREQRRVYRRRATLQARSVLDQCFRAWRGLSGADAGRLHQARKRCDLALAQHMRTMQYLSRQLREAHRADEAEYVRLMYQDCREQGPTALARRLRSVLRSGRATPQAGLPEALKAGGEVVTDPNAILRAFGAHFADAEDATEVRLDSFAIAHQPGQEQVALDGAPTLADVSASFASLKSGKAPGLSGIPSEAYSQCAPFAAVCHMPLVLKAIGRRHMPLLWTGMRAHPIPKAGKPADLCLGYRSIALAEPACKAITKATRRELSTAFERKALPTIGGARAAFPAEVPSMAVRSHIAALKQQRKAGSVLFVDGVSAFYAAHRGHLFTSEAGALKQYIESLPLEPEVRTRIMCALADTGALERAGISDATVTLLRAAFHNTWFSVDATAPLVYKTAKGTVPGSPVADMLFQYVIEASMACLCSQLRDEGVAAQFTTGDDAAQASPQSWLDDIAVLVTSATPDMVAADTSRAASLVCQYLSVAGIEVNFSAGKTEAVVCLHGAGSAKARETLFVTQAAEVDVRMPDNRILHLRCVDRYTHLGVVRDGRAEDVTAVTERAKLARDVFPAFKRRILANAHLTLPERQNLLVAVVLAKFLHGAGTWTLDSAASKGVFDKYYMGFLRGSVKPLHKVSCRRLNAQQVCALTATLLPDEALAVRRVRVLAQLHQRADAYLIQSLVAEGKWLQQVRTDVLLIASLLSDASLLSWVQSGPTTEGLILAWPRDRPATTSLLQRFRKACIASRSELVPGAIRKAEAHQAVADAGLHYARIPQACHPATLHRCDVCNRGFRGAARLAVHRAKTHGVRAMQTYAWGTACEVCRRQYWDTARLRDHFRRSPACAFKYQQAEVEAAAVPEQCAPRSTPPTALVGPTPWWATLRPQPQPAAESPTPGNHDDSLDISQLVELHQVTTFVQHWLRLVETGISWHAGFGEADWQRPLVQLAAVIAENIHLVDGEHTFETGDFAVVLQGDAILFGPAEALRRARATAWPFL
ncbi:unnamed protein product [Symbiodinium sp. CCMP2592]|nr:unnamed protein product [Symbiodinium sp. CCMP2592]